MRHQTALVIAGVLTAFVLIFAGGIAITLNPRDAVETPQPAAVIPTRPLEEFAIALPTTLPTATATSVPTSHPTPPQTVFLSTEQAKKIALKLAVQAKMTNPPELVNYKGRMAYEVQFDAGIVYIDAFTGKVLLNGIGLAMAQPTPVPYTGPSSSGGGGGGGGGDNSSGDTVSQPTEAAPPPSAPPQSDNSDDSWEEHEDEYEHAEEHKQEDEQVEEHEHEQEQEEHKDEHEQEHEQEHEDEHDGEDHN